MAILMFFDCFSFIFRFLSVSFFLFFFGIWLCVPNFLRIILLLLLLWIDLNRPANRHIRSIRGERRVKRWKPKTVPSLASPKDQFNHNESRRTSQRPWEWNHNDIVYVCVWSLWRSWSNDALHCRNKNFFSISLAFLDYICTCICVCVGCKHLISQIKFTL